MFQPLLGLTPAVASRSWPGLPLILPHRPWRRRAEVPQPRQGAPPTLGRLDRTLAIRAVDTGPSETWHETIAPLAGTRRRVVSSAPTQRGAGVAEGQGRGLQRGRRPRRRGPCPPSPPPVGHRAWVRRVVRLPPPLRSRRHDRGPGWGGPVTAVEQGRAHTPEDREGRAPGLPGPVGGGPAVRVHRVRGVSRSPGVGCVGHEARGALHVRWRRRGGDGGPEPTGAPGRGSARDPLAGPPARWFLRPHGVGAGRRGGHRRAHETATSHAGWAALPRPGSASQAGRQRPPRDRTAPHTPRLVPRGTPPTPLRHHDSRSPRAHRVRRLATPPPTAPGSLPGGVGEAGEGRAPWKGCVNSCGRVLGDLREPGLGIVALGEQACSLLRGPGPTDGTVPLYGRRRSSGPGCLEVPRGCRWEESFTSRHQRRLSTW